jgi:glycine hydroxymethyltransferase
MSQDVNLVSGGTDNHLMLVDLTNKDLSGKDAENMLGLAGITVNKNAIPNDPRGPMVTTGVRMGTPLLTSRGMKEAEMKTVAQCICDVLDKTVDPGTVKTRVLELCRQFPLYDNR